MQSSRIEIKYENFRSLDPLWKSRKVQAMVLKGSLPEEDLEKVGFLMKSLRWLEDLEIDVYLSGKEKSGTLYLPPGIKKLKLSGVSPDPEQLARLSRLEMLSLNRIPLLNMAEKLGQLPALKFLLIERTRIETLIFDKVINRKLERLELAENELRNFEIRPSASFPGLKMLGFFRNKLDRLELSQESLPNLETLLVSNRIPDMESVGNLSRLKSFDLSLSNLGAVPTVIRKLKTLRKLGLAHNQIKEVPAWITEMGTLDSVDLRGNWLSRYPRALVNKEAIRKYNLGWNPFFKEGGFRVSEKMEVFRKSVKEWPSLKGEEEAFLMLYWGNLKRAAALCSLPFLYRMLEFPLEIVRWYANAVIRMLVPLRPVPPDVCLRLSGWFQMSFDHAYPNEALSERLEQAGMKFSWTVKQEEGWLFLAADHGLNQEDLAAYEGNIYCEAHLEDLLHEKEFPARKQVSERQSQNLLRLLEGEDHVYESALKMIKGLMPGQAVINKLLLGCFRDRKPGFYDYTRREEVKKILETLQHCLPIHIHALFRGELFDENHNFRKPDWQFTWYIFSHPDLGLELRQLDYLMIRSIAEGLAKENQLTAAVIDAVADEGELSMGRLLSTGIHLTIPLSESIHSLMLDTHVPGPFFIKLENAGHIRKFFLGGHGLFDIPDFVKQLSGLEELEILSIKGKVAEPDWLSKTCPRIRKLKVKTDFSEGLPAVFGELTCLEQLVLEDLHINELPGWLPGLKNLRKLELVQCWIAEIPAWLGKMTQLQHLVLKGLRLNEFPIAIRELKGLRELVILENHYGNHFTTAPHPELLSWFPHLETLSLRHYWKVKAPEAGALDKLKALDLVSKYSEGLPEWLFYLKGLEKLSLTSSAKEIDGPWSELENLRELDISNKLRMAMLLPESWKTAPPPQLEKLVLSRNFVFSLQPNLQSVLYWLRSLKTCYLPVMGIDTMKQLKNIRPDVDFYAGGKQY